VEFQLRFQLEFHWSKLDIWAARGRRFGRVELRELFELLRRENVVSSGGEAQLAARVRFCAGELPLCVGLERRSQRRVSGLSLCVRVWSMCVRLTNGGPCLPSAKCGPMINGAH